MFPDKMLEVVDIVNNKSWLCHLYDNRCYTCIFTLQVYCYNCVLFNNTGCTIIHEQHGKSLTLHLHGELKHRNITIRTLKWTLRSLLAVTYPMPFTGVLCFVQSTTNGVSGRHGLCVQCHVAMEQRHGLDPAQIPALPLAVDTCRCGLQDIGDV